MPYVLGALALLALMLGPMAYVRWVMAWHGKDRADIPGTGGELARHLLDSAGLPNVAVEATDRGDHYDPDARAVRLSPEHVEGRSITALAVAAHEVGHALQHRDGSALFALRLAMARGLQTLDRVAAVVLVAAPLIAAVTRAPGLFFAQVAAGVGLVGISFLVQMATLPLEWDASYRRALPALRDGILQGRDIGRARSVLRAAALTYVASALLSVLNLARVARLFR